MRHFIDKERNLEWVSGDRLLETPQNEVVFNAKDCYNMKDFKDEMNEWKSDNISDFITSQNLGDFLFGLSLPEERYFAFENGKFVTCALFCGKEDIHKKIQMIEYLERCKERDFYGINGYMSRQKVKKALENNLGYNNSRLAYLVVNPKAQGNGVGTNSVKSMLENLDFFAGDFKHNTVETLVHEENIASNKVMQKNGFELLYRGAGSADFNDYFYVM